MKKLLANISLTNKTRMEKGEFPTTKKSKFKGQAGSQANVKGWELAEMQEGPLSSVNELLFTS